MLTAIFLFALSPATSVPLQAQDKPNLPPSKFCLIESFTPRPSVDHQLTVTHRHNLGPAQTDLDSQ